MIGERHDRGIAKETHRPQRTLTAYIEYDDETRLYVGIVPGVPGAHTQAASLDELRSNLQEVVALCLEEDQDLHERLPKFVGVQQIEIG